MSWIKYPLYPFLILIAILLIYYGARTIILFRKTIALEKSLSPFEQKPKDRKGTILIVGDSTAVGTGSKTPEESIAGRFGSLFPDATIINEGVNGQKIRELVDSFNSQDLKHVNLMIIQIGANDIVQFTSIKEVEKNLNIILEKAHKISDRIVLLHGGNIGNAPIFPQWLSFIWDNRTRSLRDLYIQEAEKNDDVYIDLYQSRKNDIFLTDPQKYYANDLFHPSGDGYKVWFDKIVSTLQQKYGNDFLN